MKPRRGRNRTQGARPQAPGLAEQGAALFVDTGAWFAVQTPDDQWHAQASASLRMLLSANRVLVTTNHVVGETYTLIVMRQGLAAARRFTALLRQSPRVAVVHVDETVERAAWELLERSGDHPFSFVDGTSFATMQSRGLTRAFAFDRHFRTAGFTRVPLDVEL